MTMSVVETLVPVEEYLSTSYDPDCEYVDGQLVERNVGDILHSLSQSNILFAVRTKYPRVITLPELRSQTRATRFRLPDVTVLLAMPRTEYLIDAAFIAIEILSKDDRMTNVMEKLLEYEAKGVKNIWLIDPRLQQMSVFRDGALRVISGPALTTTNPEIQLTRE